MFRLILVSTLVALAYARAPYVHLSTPTLDGRIVGGRNTTIEEHPYQASFQLAKDHYCGASLIAPNVALTAAHCTEGLGNFIRFLSVRAGTATSKGGQSINVKSIHDHAKYNPKNSYDFDVSVLVLEDSFKLDGSTQLIPLQAENEEVATGDLGRVTGWGTLSSGGSSPKVLQAVDVPKVDQEKCQTNYPRENISDRMHCFGYPDGGKDSCQGDSGGPLVVDGKQVGIVSWGYGCAYANLPGVYAKVANNEITSHINAVLRNYS